MWLFYCDVKCWFIREILMRDEKLRFDRIFRDYFFMIWTREVLHRIEHGNYKNDKIIRFNDFGDYFGDSWDLMDSVINLTLFLENSMD